MTMLDVRTSTLRGLAGAPRSRPSPHRIALALAASAWLTQGCGTPAGGTDTDVATTEATSSSSDALDDSTTTSSTSSDTGTSTDGTSSDTGTSVDGTSTDTGTSTDGTSSDTGIEEPCVARPLVLVHAVDPHEVEVPPSCSTAIVTAWGAGGGGGVLIEGGGGAYVQARFDVAPGEVLSVAVANGGQGGPVPAFSSLAGGGGGATIVRRDEDLLLVAAGGGGGGSTGDGTIQGGAGGAGGGDTGQAGDFGYDCDLDDGFARGGLGGTQSAGGAGGSGPSLGDAYPAVGAGWPGASLAGGDGGSFNPGLAEGGEEHLGGASEGYNGTGGGGGAGYYGGGGGGYQWTYCGGGGGGGSSFTTDPTAVVEAGFDFTPGGQLDPDYVVGTGDGGAAESFGSDGLAIVRFE